MMVSEVKDKEIWNSFIKQNGEYSAFLHSWQWGDFQQQVGRKIKRLGVWQDSELVAAVLLIEHKLPLGQGYFYIPRGPIINFSLENKKEAERVLLDKVQNIARKDKKIFLRIDPARELLENIIPSTDIRKINSIQPADSLVMDLKRDKEEILKNMYSKTRYNIRLSKRKGVKVRFSSEKKDLEDFLQLMELTSRRDKFRSHSKGYYQSMLTVLGEDMLQIALAERQGGVLAANLVVFFGNTATYLHGASSNKYRNVMAPHLLQWQTILEAKKRDFQYYDFWGIAPQGSVKEKAWSGITRFKKGFGGCEINYPPSLEIDLNGYKYFLYNIIRNLKNIYGKIK